MTSPSGSLASSIRDLASEDRERHGAHPTPDELLAYDARGLAEDDFDRVQDHLALCPTCAKTVLDMANFAELEPEDESRRVDDAGVADAWQAMQERLTEEELPKIESVSPLEPAPPPDSIPMPQPSPGRIYALAATLATACLGLLFWNVGLRTEIGELRRPAFNVPAVTLLAVEDSTVRSGGAEVPTIQGSQKNLVNLYFYLPPEVGSFELHLVDGNGTTLLQREGSRQDEESSNLFLHADSFPPGDYEIHLFLERESFDATGEPYRVFCLKIV